MQAPADRKVKGWCPLCLHLKWTADTSILNPMAKQLKKIKAATEQFCKELERIKD